MKGDTMERGRSIPASSDMKSGDKFMALGENFQGRSGWVAYIVVRTQREDDLRVHVPRFHTFAEHVDGGTEDGGVKMGWREDLLIYRQKRSVMVSLTRKIFANLTDADENAAALSFILSHFLLFRLPTF